ncbi:KedN5 family methylcobalamin-dependent radical SAM C-methyltransferase [Saccharopolyspora cebuensis]|uniref:KedN5 family methylcobalamin-dependent radical SAM C-methyltransferase n=1 Tax=Saccharopolyspora cebuensis TaxID=418759 RepID=A0ABV4CML5_9PSEU
MITLVANPIRTCTETEGQVCVFSVSIVQQSAWDIPMDSVPLAAGYLKAVIEQDGELATQVDVAICNFRGGMTLPEMGRRLFTTGVPDVLAFSVVGWNYRNFTCLAETYKQLRPDGLVIFGGNHVSYQAQKVFREAPSVDVVINGEGERTFRELVSAVLAAPKEPDFASVHGLSYLDVDGTVQTTPDRERIEDLDEIPSPFLTGAIPLTDDAGRFPYEFALLETNRGCPYKCSFCYWGGAVGQRVRSFSRERLAAELDLFGFHQVETVFLCDANFGMLEADEEFVEDLARVRQRYGYPASLEANWAKNKSARFHRIVKELQAHGLKSSFTLALQTLTEDALSQMRRRNMKVNQWEDLVDWLEAEGLDCFAELIWGAPGDTPASFLEGYDRLAERVPRIAVYPLLLLPNTDYIQQRELHGFTTLRGQHDDFEYVLANRSSPLHEHLQMQRFMYLARLLGENQYFKRLWKPARLLAGLSQSQVIYSLLGWLETSHHPTVAAFLDSFPVIAESPAVAAGHRMLYTRPELDIEIQRWWGEAVVSAFPEQWQDFGTELYIFERWCRPVYQGPEDPLPAGWSLDDDQYLSDPVPFSFPMEELLEQLTAAHTHGPRWSPVTYRFRSTRGFYYHLDNHETGAHYFAHPELVSFSEHAPG